MNNLFKIIALATAVTTVCVGSATAQNYLVSSSEYSEKITHNVSVQPEGETTKISFDLNLPEKFIERDQAFVIIPKFSNGEWSESLPAISIEGSYYNRVTTGKRFFREKKYSDSLNYYKRIIYKGAQQVHYQIEIPTKPEMRNAELRLVEVVMGDCHKSDKNQGGAETDYKGQTDYSDFVSMTPSVYAKPFPPKSNRSYTDNYGNASVFKLNRWRVDAERFDAYYQKLCKTIGAEIEKEYGVINSITINAMSSPDGPVAENLRLAERRGKTLTDLVAKCLGISTDLITVEVEAENWADFIALVKASDWENKDVILSEIANNDDLDQREEALSMLPNYRNQIYPAFQNLRNCAMTVNYTVYADNARMNKSPYKRITLGDAPVIDLQQAEAAYKADKCDRTINNLVIAYMERGNYDEALAYSRKISASEQNLPEVLNNRAVLYMMMGEYPMAQTLFEKAQAAKCPALKQSVDYNEGLLNLNRKRYDVAAQKFTAFNDANAISAELYNQNFENAARKTHQFDPADAQTLFLRAVAYSHMEDDALTLRTLAEACQADASFKAQARKLVDFERFRVNPKFNEITK